MFRSLVALTSLLLSFQVGAAGLHDCEELNRIENLIAQKSFANGEVRAAHVSTEEPAAAPDHLLIFVADEPMSMTCYAISETVEADESYFGFSWIDLENIKSSYQSDKGLLLEVQTYVYDHEKGESTLGELLKVRINRSLPSGQQVRLE